MNRSREKISDEVFKRRHSATDRAFTRLRSLPFSLVLVMVLRNSVKALQNVVNEVMAWLEQCPVTASAYSQARYKFKHTAFIELNEEAVVRAMYGSNYLTFWGMRILAVDGSRLILPNTEEVRQAFGTLPHTNGRDAGRLGEHPYATASVLFDVLNRVALDATLGCAKAYEVDLAVAHLPHTRPGDLLIMDRNYASYRMLAEFVHRGRDFVIRCSSASFGPAQRMMRGEGPDSQIVTLVPCAAQAGPVRQLGLPASIKARFVRVLLNTGEWEVLVTSLLDEIRYSTTEFRSLYAWRWGIETFYGLLKTRLELENFTGNGAEAVRQDFHATIYLSGLESILTEPAQARLDARTTRYPQAVNRSVSFNAIKMAALELLSSDLNLEPLLERLTQLFQTSPVTVRPDRSPPRRKPSDRVSLNFHKRKKKHGL